MSSPEPESSTQPGATVEGSDARLQDFRARLSDIKRYAEIDTRDDFATLSGVREIDYQLITEPPPPYPAGNTDAQTKISEELLKIQSRAEIDTRDDFATLSGVREIDYQLTEPPPAYSAGNTDAQTKISEELLEIQSRERYDQMDRLASLRDMTQVERLTESSVPAADDRQARIAAKTTELRQRWQVERDVHEANTAGREAQEADDLGLSHSLWLPGY
jgi:hypothetical protein